MSKGFACVGYINVADSGSVSASSEATTLPAAHLQDHDINRLWRATSGTSATISANFTSQEIGYVLVANTNATAAVVTVGAFASETITIDPRYRRLAVAFIPVTTGSVSVELSGASATVQAGRLATGPAWIMPYDISVSGHQGSYKDNSRITRGLGGHVFADVKPRQKVWRLTFPGVPLADVQEEVEELNRICGLSRDVFVMFDAASNNPGRDSIWGLQVSSASYRSVDVNVYTVDMEVEERI